MIHVMLFLAMKPLHGRPIVFLLVLRPPSIKVDIQIPLYRDERTPEFQEAFSSSSPPTIHMDAMAFGMGCCCLQVTFQARGDGGGWGEGGGGG